MIGFTRRILLANSSLALFLLALQSAHGATPSVDHALRLKPTQSDVDLETPTGAEVAKCSVEGKSGGGVAGWIVRNGARQLLRRFLDTNGDSKLDLWCYYNTGIEVYRDIDSDFNGKADQYRWMGTAGIRWGLDGDEDGRIDSWKLVSAEEVTSEVVAALAAADADRFKRLLPSAAELDSLGLGDVQKKEIEKKVAEAARGFVGLAQRQTMVATGSKWLHFGAGLPGVLPAGFEGSTKDVIVYDNVSAIVETGGKHAQIAIGTMIKVAGGWRVIDLPADLSDSQTAALPGGHFFQQPMATRPETMAAEGSLSETVQKLIRDLENVDKSIAAASGPAELATLNARRADVLEQLAENAGNDEERDTWMRQCADSISAAAQSGGYPDGVERLKKLGEKLAKDSEDSGLVAHIKFASHSADYGSSLQSPEADYPKIQEKWLTNLRQFVRDFPQSEDAAEAMLQLAIGEEFAGKPDDAIAWYARIVQGFPSSQLAKKAAGAKRRLESVGKTIDLRGTTLDGKAVSLAAYRGRIVLVHYWATWCEPFKQDVAVLKSVQAKYARQGFSLIGVNLDEEPAAAMDFLRSNSLPWPQLHESGGLDSPLAIELGIITLPTMILVDDQGKVLNRGIHAGELDEELAKRLR
ncbi:MAG: redoxin domain-containing protein [Planctomycetes bacterium]|nr:redoxin domain-containing protein [Planctomycetota bacterium]MBL7041876.1 redoxin domain-containing protein [Pirellulaceae bacterium]